jgi:hypothetical protein
MQRLRQSFQNSTDRPQFINLELSTARFRLNPKEELVLFYDAADERNGPGFGLRIEFIPGHDGIELCVWTAEVEMFFPDGRPAPLDYGRALS